MENKPLAGKQSQFLFLFFFLHTKAPVLSLSLSSPLLPSLSLTFSLSLFQVSFLGWGSGPLTCLVYSLEEIDDPWGRSPIKRGKSSHISSSCMAGFPWPNFSYLSPWMTACPGETGTLIVLGRGKAWVTSFLSEKPCYFWSLQRLLQPKGSFSCPGFPQHFPPQALTLSMEGWVERALTKIKALDSVLAPPFISIIE